MHCVPTLTKGGESTNINDYYGLQIFDYDFDKNQISLLNDTL